MQPKSCTFDVASYLAEIVKVGRAIAKGVLKTLGVEIQSKRRYKVQVGAYVYRESAEAMQKKIKAVGFDAFIVKE